MTQAMRTDAGVLDAVRDVVDHATASMVFGAPINHNGLTVLPVAKVRGGGGGGGGGGTDPDHDGHGGGLGVSARPLGVYVIRGNRVRWRPAVDLNRVILGGQIVTAIGLLVLGGFLRARLRGLKVGDRSSYPGLGHD